MDDHGVLASLRRLFGARPDPEAAEHAERVRELSATAVCERERAERAIREWEAWDAQRRGDIADILLRSRDRADDGGAP